MGPWWSGWVMADPPTDRHPASPRQRPRGRPFVARSGPRSRPPLQRRDACALGARHRVAGRARRAGRSRLGERGRPGGGADTDAHADRDAHAAAHARPDPAVARRADRPRLDGQVLRTRLRARRRDVPVRRPRARARGPGRSRHPRPLLPWRDPGHARPRSGDPRAGPQPLQGQQGQAARHLRPPHGMGHRRDRRRLPAERSTHADADHEDDEGRHVDDLAGAGVRHDRREAAERGGQEVVRHPLERSGRPPAAVLEADHLRPVPGHAPGGPAVDADGERREPPRARALPARGRAGRDAIDVARGGAPGPGHRVALVCRPEAATRRVLLRHGRRLALAGLPRLEGRTRDDERRDRRDREPGPAQGRDRRQHDVPLGRRRRHREQRERVHVRDRQEGRRQGQLPAWIDGPSPRRLRVRRRLPVRDVAHAALLPRASLGLVRVGPAHRRRRP